MIKKYFKIGVLLLIPFIVTSIIILFIINFLTAPFTLTLSNVFKNYELFSEPFLFFTQDQMLLLISRLVAFLGLIAFTLLVGFLGRMLLMKYVLEFGDSFITRIPLINRIYKTSQDVVATLFSSSKEKFSTVVLVRFPHSRGLNIGLIASPLDFKDPPPDYVDHVAVFVPGGPNPSIGFNLLVKKEDLIFLEMKVEDALKFIVSCGVVFKVEQPVNNA